MIDFDIGDFTDYGNENICGLKIDWNGLRKLLKDDLQKKVISIAPLFTTKDANFVIEWMMFELVVDKVISKLILKANLHKDFNTIFSFSDDDSCMLIELSVGTDNASVLTLDGLKYKKRILREFKNVRLKEMDLFNTV